MALKKPDISEHNNPNLAYVDSDFVRGGIRSSVADLSALISLSAKVDQMKEFATQIWVETEEAFYLLVDIVEVDSILGWRKVGDGWGTSGTTVINENTIISFDNGAFANAIDYVDFEGLYFRSYLGSGAPENTYLKFDQLEGDIKLGSTIGGISPLAYDADYSDAFTDRSVPDWGNVWRAKGDTSLIGDTEIVTPGSLVLRAIGGLVGFGVHESVPEIGFAAYDAALAEHVSVSFFTNVGETPNAVFEDTRSITKGVEYADDYSVGFSDRSLADWGNVWKVKGSTTLTEGVVIDGAEDVDIEFNLADTSFGNSSYIEFTPSGSYFGVYGPGGVSGEMQVDNGSGEFKATGADGLTIFSVNNLNGIRINSFVPTFPGMTYQADYSANYNDRSVPDWGNVWRAKGNTIVTSPVNVFASGDLFLTNDVGFNRYVGIDSTSAYVGTDFVSLTVTQGSAGPVTFLDGRTVKKGIEYAGDYSGDFTSRSLIDMGFGDSNYYMTASGNIGMGIGLVGTSRLIFADGTEDNVGLLFEDKGVGGVGILSGGNITFTSSNGNVELNSPAGTTIRYDNGTTNNVNTMLFFQRGSSGTPVNGIGAGIGFNVETAADNFEVGAFIDVVAVDVDTPGHEDFDFVLRLMFDGAAATEALRVKSNKSVVFWGPPLLPGYLLSFVPDATLYSGGMIYVTNEAGGAVPAFSDGTNWRRVTDRAIIS